MPLAALALHYNPAGYQNARDNFRRFARAFAGCPLFTVEVSFNGFFHLDTTWRIHGTPANLLWQKEALLNWMVAQLPARFDRVAWIDADMLFLNDQWARQTERLLETFPVVQLYRAVHYLNSAGVVDRSIESLASRLQNGTPGQRQPGGAWAAHRDLVARHGIYPYNIVGGGDCNWVDACLGKRDGYITTLSSPKLNSHFHAWAAAFHQEVRGQIGCTPGDLVHLYHGEFKNRQYVQRTEALRAHDYDPVVDVRIAETGLLEWSSAKPALHASLVDYFANRNEDDPNAT